MWFDANFMKLNQLKCHLLLSSSSPQPRSQEKKYEGAQVAWKKNFERGHGSIYRTNLCRWVRKIELR